MAQMLLKKFINKVVAAPNGTAVNSSSHCGKTIITTAASRRLLTAHNSGVFHKRIAVCKPS